MIGPETNLSLNTKMIRVRRPPWWGEILKHTAVKRESASLSKVTGYSMMNDIGGSSIGNEESIWVLVITLSNRKQIQCKHCYKFSIMIDC